MAGDKGTMGERGPAGVMVQRQLVIMTTDYAVLHREGVVNQDYLDEMEGTALTESQEERCYTVMVHSLNLCLNVQGPPGFKGQVGDRGRRGTNGKPVS